MSRYAFVTGGSRGIGRAVCVRLAQMGFCVVINYVSNDDAAKETLRLVEEAGGSGRCQTRSWKQGSLSICS